MSSEDESTDANSQDWDSLDDSVCVPPVVRENLGSPGLFNNRLAFVLHNVLSQEECAEVARAAENAGFKQATIRTGFKTVQYNPDLRQGENCYLTDSGVGDRLFSRVRDHLPKEFRFGKLIGLNERMTVLRYGPGGFFGEHTDGTVITQDNSAISFITIQLYLNEGFEGGETIFYPDGLARGGGGGAERRRVAVTPRTGSAAVFEHKILHEGGRVASGCKLTLRADVMYTRYFPPVDEAELTTQAASAGDVTSALSLLPDAELPWDRDRPASSKWSYCTVQ